MRFIAIATCLLLSTLVPSCSASSGAAPPDCRVLNEPLETVYCLSRNVDSPAMATTHAAVAIVAAGCEVTDITAHGAGKGGQYEWELSAGSAEEHSSGALIQSPLIRDGGFTVPEGGSVGASAHIWNVALAFDQAKASDSWTCNGGILYNSAGQAVEDLASQLLQDIKGQ